MRTYPSQNISTKRTLLIASVGCALIVLAAALAIAVPRLIQRSTSTPANQTARNNGGPQNTDKGQPAADNASQPSGSTTQPGDNKGNNGGNTSTDLTTPWGDFVSAHVNISGNTPLASVCNTTPGATCQITLTNGNTTKTLTAQTTDRNGSTYWNSWTPNSVGLYPGAWTVRAVASLNGATKTATDATALEITQ